MPTLYTMPGTCALAPNIAVQWEKAPVKIHALAYGAHKDAAYLTVNPKGQVPAMQFEDGEVLTEATAILRFIGAAYGGEGFGAGTEIGRRENEALSFMSSEVHATFGPHFGAAKFIDGEREQASLQEKAYGRLHKQFTLMNETLVANGGEYYLGERSYADAYAYVLFRWIEKTPLNYDDYPALKSHAVAMQRDDGVMRALDAQNMQPLKFG